MSRIVASFLVVLSSFSGFSGQATATRIAFTLYSNGKAIVLPAEAGDGRIDLVRFYISSVAFYKGSKEVWQEPAGYHLVDFSNEVSSSFLLDLPQALQFDRIAFKLGIDSLTNVSGVMGGDLDPARGMYWTWQSGYINFKVEGTSATVPTARHEFRFHLGGYTAPHATLQKVELSLETSSQLNVGFDIGAFLDGIKFSETHSIMSPGSQAVLLSVKAAKSFFVAR